jgi:hypothetical protein
LGRTTVCMRSACGFNSGRRAGPAEKASLPWEIPAGRAPAWAGAGLVRCPRSTSWARARSRPEKTPGMADEQGGPPAGCEVRSAAWRGLGERRQACRKKDPECRNIALARLLQQSQYREPSSRSLGGTNVLPAAEDTQGRTLTPASGLKTSRLPIRQALTANPETFQ